MAANGPPADGVVNKELTEKNLVETHEGGLGQDGSENQQKVEGAWGLEPKFWIDPTRMSLLLGRLIWQKWRNLQNTIQVNQEGTRTTHIRVYGARFREFKMQGARCREQDAWLTLPVHVF